MHKNNDKLLDGGDGNDTYFMDMGNSTSTDFAGRIYNFMTLAKDTIIYSDGVGRVTAGVVTVSGGKSVNGSTTNIIKGNFSRLSELKGV